MCGSDIYIISGSLIPTADDKRASCNPASVGMALSLASDQLLIHFSFRYTVISINVVNINLDLIST